MFPSWYNEDLKAKYLEIDPSWDGTCPVYISDWEWMFDIFTKAQADLGITDGYCLSVYYKGYNEDGSLFSSFGGSFNGEIVLSNTNNAKLTLTKSKLVIA